MVSSSSKKWSYFQDRFLKVHVDIFSNHNDDNEVQNAEPVEDIDSLMNLAAVGIEYFLENGDPIDKVAKQDRSCKSIIGIPASRKLLRFLTKWTLKLSSKIQLYRICVLRRLFRLWSTISTNQRNVRLELREITERTKVYVSKYFAVLNLHNRWSLRRSISMWLNVQYNREKVIKMVLLRQYCRPSISYWRKVYNHRLIARNLKPSTTLDQDEIYDYERKKLQSNPAIPSTEKIKDKLIYLKSSSKKKLRFSESINDTSIIIPRMLTFDENQSFNTPTTRGSVHWSELITDDEKSIKKSTRGYLYRHEFRNDL
jgi:hypothetical protein